jgi:hypothetical protein
MLLFFGSWTNPSGLVRSYKLRTAFEEVFYLSNTPDSGETAFESSLFIEHSGQQGSKPPLY